MRNGKQTWIASNADRSDSTGRSAIHFTERQKNMKKRILCLLAALLLLAGCRKQEENKEQVLTGDALCPYRITCREGILQIEAKGDQVQNVFWEATVVPEDVCGIRQTQTQDGSCSYQITGTSQGAAQVCVRAYSGEDAGNLRFELMVDVSVDGQMQVSALQARHRQTQLTVMESENLHYKWEVDMQGILRFVLKTEQTNWTLHAQPSAVCTVSDGMYSPSGFSFEAEPGQAGTATVTLQEKDGGQTLAVLLRVDEAGNITVESVQEQ